MALRKGLYTAVITPFKKDGSVDYGGLKKIVKYLVAHKSGILAVGTTGESATLSHKEHFYVATAIAEFSKGEVPIIIGTGSNNTEETIFLTKMIQYLPGLVGVLIVDPYYNGPSSLEIREEYIRPIAEAFPRLEVIPYIIPGRTGAQFYPEDLAVLAEELKNVNAVKEATGDFINMVKTRKKCGEDFLILSGDDGMTLNMMFDPMISAGGVISVMSNIFPGPIKKMIDLSNQGDFFGAEEIAGALKPIFDIVTIETFEDHGYGKRKIRARNPLPVKTLMNLLGMPAGPCRRPLGKMTKPGFEILVNAMRTIWRNNPSMLEPVADFFDVDIEEKMFNNHWWDDLVY